MLPVIASSTRCATTRARVGVPIIIVRSRTAGLTVTTTAMSTVLASGRTATTAPEAMRTATSGSMDEVMTIAMSTEINTTKEYLCKAKS